MVFNYKILFVFILLLSNGKIIIYKADCSVNMVAIVLDMKYLKIDIVIQ